MPRVPSRPNHLTPLGEIIWNAMERRTAERGAFYTYACWRWRSSAASRQRISARSRALRRAWGVARHACSAR